MLLDLVRLANNFPSPSLGTPVPLRVGNCVVGVLIPSILDRLREWNAEKLQNGAAPFLIDENGVTFNETFLKSFEDRTRVMEELLQVWKAEGGIKALDGWRNEIYPVYVAPREIALVMERAGTYVLGVQQFSAHINGFVRAVDTGEIKMWIGRRALTKQTFPGLLDNMVGGGIPYPQKPFETAVREAAEEASIPENVARRAKSVSTINFFHCTNELLMPEVIYIYDLELPNDIIPQPCDGEVDCFYLWNVDDIKKHLLAKNFQPGCALVVLDFLIRHSLLTSYNEPEYLEIVNGLHRQWEYASPSFI